MEIAILGYGTVGSGVVEVIQTNKKSIQKKAGQNINIKYVLDTKEFPGSPIEKVLTKNFQDILEDDEVKIVVEVMGGVSPAYKFVKESLLKGKSVVTSNKELVATHGPELLAIAKENQSNFLFEASVGGGIPIIRPLNQSLTADKIQEITGILNGTTNFILTKMEKEKVSYEEALQEAQNLGYAERNPKADVEGHDTCRKIAILSSLAYNVHVNYEEIYTEGITKIRTKDFAYAKQINSQIKLVGTSNQEAGKMQVYVAPMLIPNEHPLANIHDVFNGIFINGNVIGDIMFYGSGAGKLPTAAAVVADIVDATKHEQINIATMWNVEKAEIIPFEKIQFDTLLAFDKKEKTEEIKEQLGEVQVLEAETEAVFIIKHKAEIDIDTIVEQIEQKYGTKNITRIRIKRG